MVAPVGSKRVCRVPPQDVYGVGIRCDLGGGRAPRRAADETGLSIDPETAFGILLLGVCAVTAYDF